MGKILLVITCSFLLFMTSCTEYLYFDSAPKNNIDIVNSSNVTGVYQLKITGFVLGSEDSLNDHFKLNNYNNYIAPILKTNTEDTLQYLGSKLYSNRSYLEITEKNGVLHFFNFGIVNKNIFYQFFKTNPRIINDKNGDYTSISMVQNLDSIALKFHHQSHKNKPPEDTTLYFKTWLQGDLLYFTKNDKKYFPDSISLNSNNKKANAYITNVQEKLYLIQKDISNEIKCYKISQLQLDKNSFTITTISRKESLLELAAKNKIKFKNDVIQYNESQLNTIFSSPLATIEVVANRINGFPSLANNSSLSFWDFKTNYSLVIGILLLTILLGYFVYKQKK